MTTASTDVVCKCGGTAFSVLQLLDVKSGLNTVIATCVDCNESYVVAQYIDVQPHKEGVEDDD